jgi:flagellar capping protein FliD
VLSGTDTTKGVMDIMSSVADAFTAKDKGLLAIKSNSLTDQVKRLQSRIDREEIRINRYGDQLRKQFTSMDTQVASWNNLGSYLSSAL